MAAVDNPGSDTLEQRLPSTKPIDARWDRSRSIILRNAEHNALRDFRWTHNDPITFAETPAYTRNNRNLLRKVSGQEPHDASTGGSTSIDSPHQVHISSEDRLNERIKQLQKELSGVQQDLDQAKRAVIEKDQLIRSPQKRQTEKDHEQNNLSGQLDRRRNEAARKEQDVAKREAQMQETIATNQAKARDDANAALQQERAVYMEEKTQHEVDLEKGWQDLRNETLKFDSMKAEARKEAESKAKATYEKRNADLEKKREDLQKEHAQKAAAQKEEDDLLKSGWADLEVKESAVDTKVADATKAAEAAVRKEHQDFLDSATLKETSAQVKLDEATQFSETTRRDATQHLESTQKEAKQLLDDARTEANRLEDDARKDREDATTDRTRLAQSYERKMDDELKRFTAFLNTNQEAFKIERQQAIGDFAEKLKDAEYREQIERMDYDAYWEVWRTLRVRTYTLSKSLGQISRLHEDAADAWRKTLSFDPSKIHRSFPSNYPVLAAQIEAFLSSSCESTIQASNDAEQLAKKMAEDIRPRLISQAHYSRLLTSSTRYEQSQSKGSTMKALSEVLGSQVIKASIKTLLRRRNDLAESLGTVPNESPVTELSASIKDIDNQVASLKAVDVFLSAFVHDQSLSHLREDSIPEKEIWDALDPMKRAISKATKPLNDLKEEHPSYVDRSVVSKEKQQEDRTMMDQTMRALKNERRKYHDIVRETSLLEQHLGEGGERVLAINARIDEKKRDAHMVMFDKLAILAGTSGARLLAVSSRSGSPSQTTRRERLLRSIAASRTSSVPPKISPAKPAPSRLAETLKHRQRSRDIQTLRSQLKNKTSFASDTEREKVEEKLQELKLEDMQLNLERLRQNKALLLAHPEADPTKLRQVEMNITGIERVLGLPSSSSNEQQASAEASPVDSNVTSQKLTRRKRMASTKKAGATSASASANVAVSSEPESDTSSTLNLKPTKPQQSSHPIHIHHMRPCGSQLGRKGSAYSANAAMMARLLHPSEPAPYVPRALQVYSLHSLHTAAPGEHAIPDPQADFNPDTSSTFPTMHLFNESVTLTQSSMETISDPESDDSYEPSDSEGSVASSKPAEAVSGTIGADPSISSLASTQEFADALETQSTTNAVGPTEQIDSDLTYNISPEDYRRAAMASSSNNAGFWTYKLYKNAEGKTPTVYYCTTFESAETQAKQFLDEPILGFDLEWEVGSSPGKSSIKNCVSLVQIASETKIGLFQLAMFKGATAEQLMPPSLRKIIESREVTKAGVNISGDASRIEKCFGFKMQGIFELSHLYNVVTWSATSPEKVNKKLFKLADQVQNVLLLPLKKDQVRTSKWSLRLRPEQTEYAASDAYAGFRIYHALEARRKKMNPTPPRPAFWEEKKPLVLGDGTVVVTRRVVKKKVDEKGQVVEEEDEEGEEYFDAVESLDPYEFDPSSTGGIPLEGLSISYPTLPTLAETLAESNTSAKSQQPANSTTEPSSASSSTATLAPTTDPKPKSTPLTSPAVTAADTWAQSFRNGLPATHNLRNKQAHLRAYHLWHHQRHECKDVASLLRDPPLSVTTVASYVLQTVAEGKERLEWERIEKERFLSVVELLPSSVRGKYWWVVERIEREEVERRVVEEYM